MEVLEIRHMVKKAFSKLFSSGGFNYNYKPFSLRGRATKFISSNSKQLFIALVVVFFLSFSYLMTNALTGYITYQESLEDELNKTKNILAEKENQLSSVTSANDACKTELQTKLSELGACNSKLSESESYLVSCETERDDLKEYSKEINSLLVTCEQERSDFSTKYNEISAEYSSLVKNTAADVCCRPGIENSNWGIVYSRVVCYGDFTVDCTSGETNY